jgi:NAD(P)-dependent dehydrogenase (short-subunit alcohol dehydrogenase family)
LHWNPEIAGRAEDTPSLLIGLWMELSLEGKTAVVVGGTLGIGRALALGLAAAGADVVATSRSQDGVESVAAEIEQLGRRTLRMTSDVTDRSTLERVRDAMLAEFGKIDILVNSAGITRRIPTLECTEEIWESIMDINLTGTLRSCQVFGSAMLEQGDGRIVNIASMATFVAFHEVAAYGASKAAVGSLTRSLAVEWAQRGVRVNAIAPGIIPTALNRDLLQSARGRELLMRTPMARFGNVDEIVGAAVYLASDASSYTTGQILVVDGGQLASGVNQ